jgi:hypothetical protein
MRSEVVVMSLKLNHLSISLILSQTSRKLAAFVSDTTLSFDNGRSGSLSLVFSSTKEVASCKMSIASSSSFIEELSSAVVVVDV